MSDPLDGFEAGVEHVGDPLLEAVDDDGAQPRHPSREQTLGLLRRR